MHTNIVLFLFLFSIVAGFGEGFEYRHHELRTYDGSSSSPGLPKITSRGETVRVAIGERVVLPCQVSNLGSYVLVWQKGSDVLTAKSIMVTPDPRFRLVNKHGLQIHGIRSQDAGDYTCKISLMGEPVAITHTLEILGG